MNEPKRKNPLYAVGDGQPPAGNYGSNVTGQLLEQAAPVDNRTPGPEDREMSEISAFREELNAKLAGNQASIDAKLASFELRQSQALESMTAELRLIRSDLDGLKALKWQLWAAFFSAIALIYALIAYGATTFEGGRNTAALVHEAQVKMEEAARQAKQTQEDTNRLIRDALKAVGSAPRLIDAPK